MMNNAYRAKYRTKYFGLLLSIWVVSALGRAASAEPFAALPAYQAVRDQALPPALQDLVYQSKPGEYGAIEEKLLKAIGQPQCTRDGKALACRMLQRVGSARCVPALAAMLPDPELSHMARYALQGLDCPAAGQSLREALPRTRGAVRIGVISSLAERRDTECVEALAELAKDGDPATAEAALRGLGRIGNAAAGKKLNGIKTANASLASVRLHSLLMCADEALAQGRKRAAWSIYKQCAAPGQPTVIRLGGYRGMTAIKGTGMVPALLKLLSDRDARLARVAQRFLIEAKGEKATRQIARSLPGLPAESQIAVLSVLAIRADRTAAGEVLKFAAKASGEGKLEAFRCLGVIGNADCGPFLMQSAGEAPTKDAATNALETISDPKLDQYLLERYKQATGGERAEAIYLLAARNITAVVPELFQDAKNNDAQVRAAAIKALQELASPREWPDAVALLMETSIKDLEKTEGMVQRLATRGDDPQALAKPILDALPGARAERRCALLRTLGFIGGDAAERTVQAALADADPQVHEAALRTLASWPEARVAPAVLELAREERQPVLRILALQGYIRMAGMTGDRSTTETVAMYQKAFALATRREEKISVIAGLQNIPGPDSLATLAGYLNEPGLNDDVVRAILIITDSDWVPANWPEPVRGYLERILATTTNADFKSQAKKKLEVLPKPDRRQK